MHYDFPAFPFLPTRSSGMNSVAKEFTWRVWLVASLIGIQYVWWHAVTSLVLWVEYWSFLGKWGLFSSRKSHHPMWTLPDGTWLWTKFANKQKEKQHKTCCEFRKQLKDQKLSFTIGSTGLIRKVIPQGIQALHNFFKTHKEVAGKVAYDHWLWCTVENKSTIVTKRLKRNPLASGKNQFGNSTLTGGSPVPILTEVFLSRNWRARLLRMSTSLSDPIGEIGMIWSDKEFWVASKNQSTGVLTLNLKWLGPQRNCRMPCFLVKSPMNRRVFIDAIIIR